MALTAEDIVNKQFKPKPRLSEGYDADEVDDFLDEIVKAYRAIKAENDELNQKLVGAQGRIDELERARTAGAAPAPSAGVEGPNDSATSSQLLQLARKLHDQHIQEGLNERERIIEEGKAQVQRNIAEAEQRQKNEINELDQQRVAIERRVEELKLFEKEYRTQLKQYLETSLNDLNASGQASAANY
jgi:DivIVA domain-containing protein